MGLLEIIASGDTHPHIVQALEDFGDLRLGKGIVECKDTPGFIANRIGVYWLQCGVLEAIDGGLTIEEADAVMGRPIGIPKTGIFGLLDLIGIDLMPHIMASLGTLLPANDPFHTVNRVPEIISEMLAKGYTGRKAKTGFYRLAPSSHKKVKQAIDLNTGEFRTASRPELASVAAAKSGGLRALLEFDDPTGRYAWRVLSKTLNYAAKLIPEIADHPHAIDTAMKLGYNWEFGPFEIIDRLGVDYFTKRLREEAIEPAPLLMSGGALYRVSENTLEQKTVNGSYTAIAQKPGTLLLEDIKRNTQALIENASASLWELGDGVVCFEFHTQMNALNIELLELLEQSIALVIEKYQAMVIYNDGQHFSAGANLKVLVSAIKQAQWNTVESIINQGQRVFKSLKYAPFPVVAAPSGLALGGGCEILLQCDAIQAHAELYMGLVEVGVGLIPGWGGCKEMLQRWFTHKNRPGGPITPIAKAFETISTATVSGSAAEAKDQLFLTAKDAITMNRNRLLADAKSKALTLAIDYAPPESTEISLPGPSGRATLDMSVTHFEHLGKITAYDRVIADQLTFVLSGGNTDVSDSLTEDDLLALEREAFMTLVQQNGTLARLEHMLKTGKPLRN